MSKTKYTRAGVIPYIRLPDGTIKMLFMRPSDSRYGGDNFQIAKGKVEDGEHYSDAAFREAYEELGLLRCNVIHSQYFGIVLGKTHLYLAEVRTLTDFTATTFETAETKWMTLDEFESLGRGLHKDIVRSVYKTICQICSTIGVI